MALAATQANGVPDVRGGDVARRGTVRTICETVFDVAGGALPPLTNLPIQTVPPVCRR